MHRRGPLVYVLKITKSHETFFKFGHLKFRNNQIILFPSNSTIKQHQAVSSISFNRSTRPDNGNKTCMRVGCNNTPKKGQDYCKNHKRKSKCQFKGCGNTTKSHLRYCGLHYLEGVERNKEVNESRATFSSDSATVSNSIGVCKGCKVPLSARKEYCKSCKRDNQTLPRSGKKICLQYGCINPRSPGKIHCETHYLERYKGHSPTINRSTITKFPEIKSRPTTATPKSQSTTTKSGVFACEICGKDNTGGRIAKGVGKTVGNTTMGVFGTLTFLTGGLTAPLMLGAAMVGARISGSAENYSICAECRAK